MENREGGEESAGVGIFEGQLTQVASNWDLGYAGRVDLRHEPDCTSTGGWVLPFEWPGMDLGWSW